MGERQVFVQSIDNVSLGDALGRSWIKLFGLIPLKRWRHERSLRDDGTNTRVTDHLSFQMRRPLRMMPGAEVAAEAIVRRIFAHRHKRLRSFFAEGD